MADIKSYIKEKAKREKRQAGYKEKIVKHRLRNLYRVCLVIAAAAALVALIAVQYRRHVYTSYDIVSSVERQIASGAVDRRLGNSILTYSRDGAHCTNAKGSVTWNQTYEIQDVIIAVSGNTVAIAEYNGRNIYVQNTESQLKQITTTMPIRDVAVSSSGCVTAVLDGQDVALLYTYPYDEDEKIIEGKAHMSDSGYPAAISLSPNGEILCVSYLYLDAGVLKTDIAFYNFGQVGKSNSDLLVSASSYTDMLVPQVCFMSDSAGFAVGDSRLIVFGGGHKPTIKAERILNEEIRSVFYSEKYIGLVFRSEVGEHLYRMDVYDASAREVGKFYLDMEYSDIFFGKDNFVAYNETECLIMNMKGVEKFSGTFSKTVRLMLPTGGSYKYVLVTDNSIDTIQLK